MATEADVQAAADAIKASMATLVTDVAAEDAAIGQILTWVQQHPGTLPDALVAELQASKATIDSVISDVTTQTTNLTAGTPPP